MRKVILAATLVVALGVPSGAMAQGGVWRAHGVESGKEWGAAVSGIAPGGALGCHASGGRAATCAE
jgi:hypothetical protein